MHCLRRSEHRRRTWRFVASWKHCYSWHPLKTGHDCAIYLLYSVNCKFSQRFVQCPCSIFAKCHYNLNIYNNNNNNRVVHQPDRIFAGRPFIVVHLEITYHLWCYHLSHCPSVLTFHILLWRLVGILCNHGLWSTGRMQQWLAVVIPVSVILSTNHMLCTRYVMYRQVFLVSHLTYLVQLLYLGKLSRPKCHEFSLKFLIFPMVQY